MSSTAIHRSAGLRVEDRNPEPAGETSTAVPWLAVVADKAKTLRYGVIQIVVHDSKVVQIERTERTRFDVPGPGNGR